MELIVRKVIWMRDKGLCGICGQLADPTRWHLDHIIPIVKGGHHIYANVQVTHPVCNMRKGHRELPFIPPSA